MKYTKDNRDCLEGGAAMRRQKREDLAWRDEARGLIVDYTIAEEMERHGVHQPKEARDRTESAYRAMFEYGITHWPQPKEGE